MPGTGSTSPPPQTSPPAVTRRRSKPVGDLHAVLRRSEAAGDRRTGYLPLPGDGASTLFQGINQRYLKSSTILTTNESSTILTTNESSTILTTNESSTILTTNV